MGRSSLVVSAVFAGGSLLGALCGMGPAFAEPPTADEFRTLDTVPDRMAACSDAGADAYESGDAEQIRKAMDGEIACLTVIAADLGKTFYGAEAFGADGIEGALKRLRDPLGRLYATVQNDPVACAPACGTLYTIQSEDMYRRFLATLILDISERLKDDSPVHSE
ncbi:hypothetical protein Rru_A2945 [Rhodospirillum rubrum ATCC 11170]|uniref:Secreted protein n=1 Tax=Rhodospirillum rubrum (strain ATCC 11170 / ATH 1.1.1 / DSM 467 / LMG 4362 / NCIMB 8255 / S1) TaxID=269796 RepID=Q2RQ53_RHORT|nr:hypothetical protein [Rhodospirillum rubrum]ABC23742.1 hypothetical protein Rru_A2945 [Rhodospirillum rubrum ATCC 11170]MBK5955418.1 hypothetical protein [Rhodospirillum rubrum]QXG79696.1 hypothetical protein KUL73_15190 [Rhodospirillum rubrum]HAQ00880.1 hypothetical protein [Rhodospirillum rubrum]HCF16984.1 hypothetical protein [Rhodospirillum rubrum]